MHGPDFGILDCLGQQLDLCIRLSDSHVKQDIWTPNLKLIIQITTCVGYFGWCSYFCPVLPVTSIVNSQHHFWIFRQTYICILLDRYVFTHSGSSDRDFWEPMFYGINIRKSRQVNYLEILENSGSWLKMKTVNHLPGPVFSRGRKSSQAWYF